jgi:putative glycosyltransferase (TIGR04348 family)
MEICLVTPAPPRSQKGNRITALRWARLLRSLGHRVYIEQRYRRRRCGLLIALHARRSFASIAGYRDLHPEGPLVLALTGTDLYDDLQRSSQAQEALQLADRLVLLQPRGIEALPEGARAKARVIYQSVTLPATLRRARPGPPDGFFQVCVLGHLRPVKDPFRAALATHRLPRASRIEVIQVGQALSPAMEARAARETLRNPRYHWLGELPRAAALRVLARSHLLALTSKMEGGANAISEAVVLGVPVIASHIPGSLGLLGDDYPGYFPPGDTRALTALLRRAETDAAFYAALRAHCDRLRPLFDPAREAETWHGLLQELT